jgi:hypothetical protein
MIKRGERPLTYKLKNLNHLFFNAQQVINGFLFTVRPSDIAVASVTIEDEKPRSVCNL